MELGKAWKIDSKSGQTDREVIFLDMAPSRWSVLEAVIHVIQGRSIWWRLEDDRSRKTTIRQNMFSYRHKKIAKKLYPKCFIDTSESFNCFSSKVVGLMKSRLKTNRENLEGVFTTFSDLHNVCQSIFVIFLIELRKTKLFCLTGYTFLF